MEVAMSVVYVSEQGAYLRKSAGKYVVTFKDKEIFSVPENSVERVVVLGNVQVSTQAISELLQNGTELIFLSLNGKFKGILEPGYSKNTFMRIAQYDASLDEKFSINFAKSILRTKIESEIETVQKWIRNNWCPPDIQIKPMSDALHALEDCENHSELLGTEAQAAKIYFSALGAALPPPFEWLGRNRNPPHDPVNALLSLTYMMVLSEIVSSCYASGMDPFIGFLHKLDYSRPSFALDVLESARAPYCDHFVMKSLQRDLFTPEDFKISEAQGCRLKNDTLKNYLELYHEMTHDKNSKMKLGTYISENLRTYAESFKTRM
jgi:CRISPR-associated protein Cas1